MDNRTLALPARLIRKYHTRDPFRIADELGIRVRYIHTKRQKGFCKIFLRNRFIFLSDSMSGQMQRMTCAHELGHLLLHGDALTKQDYLLDMEIFDITDQREYEANQFAASLLIDDQRLMELLREGRDVVTAASILDINVNLLLIRLTDLRRDGLVPDLPFRPRAGFLGKVGDSAGAM